MADSSAHHEPFQYYASTANPHHLAPATTAEIGNPGRANHQYDISDFTRAFGANNLPAVTFVKAAKYQDGHAGYSDPLDEQHFVVDLVNNLQASPDWKSTAVVIAYDDSDGWYDHQMSPIVNDSQDPASDALSAPGLCGSGTPLAGYQDRCGYGTRQPLLVVSPNNGHSMLWRAASAICSTSLGRVRPSCSSTPIRVSRRVREYSADPIGLLVNGSSSSTLHPDSGAALVWGAPQPPSTIQLAWRSPKETGMAAEMSTAEQAADAGGTAGIVAGILSGANLGMRVIPVPFVGPVVGAVVGGAVGSEVGRRLGRALVAGGTAFAKTLAS